MKTASYFLIAFVFGAFFLIKDIPYQKPKEVKIKIDNNPILKQKVEFDKWNAKIEIQQKEIEQLIKSKN